MRRALPGLFAKSRFGQGPDDLAHAVGAEVEAQDAVSGTDARLPADQRGLDELVGLAALVSVAYCLLTTGGWNRSRPPATVHEHVVGALRSLPALVAVHRPVAADDRADAHSSGRVELGQVVHAGMRQRVAPVGEGVQHDIRLGRQLAAERDQRAQMRKRGVHAAVGDKAEQMDTRSVGESRAQDGVLGERAVRDRLVDAHQVLLDDRAGAKVQVADLGVAHLPFGQSHGRSAGGQRRVGELGPQLVEYRCASKRDGVAGTRLGQTPAVEHDQADARCPRPVRTTAAGAVRTTAAVAFRTGRWPVRRAHGWAAATIAANDSASSEAPPTSAPSTSGSASSSAAFSGLTEPP